MPEEKKPLQPEQPEITGWAQVNITPDMPLGLIVNFMNVLNQRLVTIENLVTTIGPDGKAISLTDLYAPQAKQEQERLAKEQTSPKEGE